MRQIYSWVFLVILGLTGLTSRAEEGTATELALAAVENFRSDKERELSEVTFPAIERAADFPVGAEVYLIKGYIDYNCLRIFRREGRVLAQRVKMTRTWSYSPKEGYDAEEIEIPEADFRRAWEAAELIRGAAMTVYPVPPSFQMSGRGGSSSHEPTIYVRMWTDTVLIENAVRGKSWRNKVQDFSFVQTRAIYKVFNDLVPKEMAGNPFPMADWGPFLTHLLTQGEKSLQKHPQRMNEDTRLTVETSLRLLGQIGYKPALETVRAVEADAQATTAEGAWWPKMMLQETWYAEAKITLKENFDPHRTARLIAETGRRIHPDRDFVQWLRDEYFARDATGYYALLSSDLRNTETNPDLLQEIIPDLSKKYPAQGIELLEGVLNHPSSEVASDAALELLRRNPDHEEALMTLSRLAASPEASILLGKYWSRYFGREQALEFLTSNRSTVPDKFRWTADRVEKQLQQPWEDGRMVHRLISLWHSLTGKPWPEAEQIAAYRRTLEGPINRGTVVACEELIKLKDRESAGKMTGLLEEMASGSDKKIGLEIDPEGIYPWIHHYDIERVQVDLKKLTE